MFFKKKNNKGFTLVEAMVAVFILTIGVIGPLSVATRGISDGFYAQNQLTALHLAQEGLEAVKVVIENNIKNAEDNPDWLEGTDSCIDTWCVVRVAEGQVNSISFSSCPLGNCTEGMAYIEEDGFYKLVGASDPGSQIFRRQIKITVEDPDKVLIQSQVHWLNKNISKSFELNAYLYDRNN